MPSYSSYLNINWNVNEFKKKMRDILDMKIGAIRADRELYTAITDRLAYHLEPFVPWDTGEMSDSAYPDAKNGLRYYRVSDKGFNIAQYQYEHPLFHNGPGTAPPGRGNNVVHPEASDHWADEYHIEKIWDAFSADVGPLIVEAMSKKKETL